MSIARPIIKLLPEAVQRGAYTTATGLQDTIENWRMPAVRVTGDPSEAGHSARVVYVGDRPQYKSWTHNIFGHAIEPEDVGTVSLPQLLRTSGPPLKTADLIFCPLNPLTTRLMGSRGWRVIPLYVNCTVELDKKISELIVSKGAKDDLRLARRRGFTFGIKNDAAALEEFFHQMLVPTVTKRHADRAFLSELDNLREKYRDGFLLCAYLEDAWVGAVLIAREGPLTIEIANIGWKDGSDDWLKQGIAGSLFNATYEWGQENGCRWVSQGSCNPFANDGPLNFKIKWGSSIFPPQQNFADGNLEGARSFVGVKINLASPTAREIMGVAPMLESAGGKLRAVGWNANVPPLFKRQVKQGFEWLNLADVD